MMINQYFTQLLSLLLAFAACNGNDKTVYVQAIDQETDSITLSGKRIRSIMQDKNKDIWFATNGDGLYRFNGKSLKSLTKKDGLCSDFVWTVQQDKTGSLWFRTQNAICRFDGKSFANYTGTYELRTFSYAPVLEFKPGNQWFGANGGVYCYDGNSFVFCQLPPKDTIAQLLPGTYSNAQNAVSVYCILEDRTGNLWFGTDQNGVCLYNGSSFTWFKGKSLTKGAIRCIFQDKAGNIWTGSNGGGVCLYDGKSVINFSEKMGLSKKLDMAVLEDKTQQLNRVWSITEDKSGNIWFATIDEGAWQYNGKTLQNFTTKDGLSSNAIWTIYKDNNDKLWFGTDGAGVCQYDGTSFIKFTGLSF